MTNVEQLLLEIKALLEPYEDTRALPYNPSGFSLVRRIKELIVEFDKVRWRPVEMAPKDGTEFIIFRYAEPSEWYKKYAPNGVPVCEVTAWQDDLSEENYKYLPLPEHDISNEEDDDWH